MPVHIWDGFSPAPAACRQAVVSIGNFDGVHLGHARLIAVAAQLAREQKSGAVALTFDPPPAALLRPEQPHLPLTTLSERCRLLERVGAAQIVVLRTTPALLELRAEEFFGEALVKRLGLRGLVEGHNFAFGKDREGTPDVLERLCGQARLPLMIVPPVLAAGAAVSSSRIREALRQGDVETARLCLDRLYALEGKVAAGQGRGRTLGFPTANLEGVETLLPKDGVYAARAQVAAGKAFPAAVNVGPNPTFGETDRKLEVHLIGFEGDLYGQQLRLEFLKRLRPTQSFASADALRVQLRRDATAAQWAIAAEENDATTSIYPQR